MPQSQTITLDDRESTPVTHSFEPNGRENGVAIFATREGTLDGANRLTMAARSTAARARCDLRLSMPVVVTETVNGVADNKIARTNRATVQFDFARNSTLQERKNLIGLIEKALSVSETDIDTFLTQAENFH